MRVIAGSARSLPLKTPEGMDTRPTTDRIKETLFNMIRNDFPGGVFVDLFSGSGGIGIEALSRGAKKAYFVENSPRAAAVIAQNLAFTKTADRAVLLKRDVCAALDQINEREVSVIFMDPPYGLGQEKRVLSALCGRHFVTAHTLIIVEADLETDFSYLEELGFSLEKEKKYKTNRHLFLRIGGGKGAL
ncbi:MAG: 16S rRNA (guanine(966)-N(2))-methyltransferase RsmD [Candidatus Gastranaerophilales bacterium]|nr:16S rRNA (guanine(966)-N(2))-methyltransferase RsmD [Candidatus Gastranaerophilales bacterium]